MKKQIFTFVTWLFAILTIIAAVTFVVSLFFIIWSDERETVSIAVKIMFTGLLSVFVTGVITYVFGVANE